MKKIIVANWKCNPTTQQEAKKLFEAYKGLKSKHEMVVCPPACFLEEAALLLKGKQGVALGAQDCFWQEKGAFTGQVSALQLKSLGVKYVILGHSEKRVLGDTDKIVNQKLKVALKANLKPILCLGETKATREKGKTFELLRGQVKSCLLGVSKKELGQIILAYEPVWAIGSGVACKEDEVLTVILYLKKLIAENYSKKISQEIKIIYGGSVVSENAKEYLNNKWIDGLLLGGASLNKKELNEIVNLI
ncbi:triose-phosphate isomerase [bacterium (Candidatus Gribaldobacteria) CG10_big_fil_rev_8_21_14_0_10_37_21]|uniref:Triosephosphate isomerase n=1 Tax=bacterium (Candidatus Gribaldobacteria) CG10_big_fil_rev_8_21_14_0_10_37_21 TaxID=2014275 RepID=A0A2H0UTM9_9BACT|nr:MAG: triose-phosphate isomerase [bacterium (Candidatus Gribaldobacteria) CG10_big_fil_rev_8_21_14_0_10_37_21]